MKIEYLIIVVKVMFASVIGYINNQILLFQY